MGKKFKQKWKWKITTDEYIERAKSIHGDTYGYELTEYVNRKTPIIITCKKHGPFSINPYNHILLGTGCIQCVRDKTYLTCALTKDGFIERAKKIIGEHYDYSRVEYVNAHTPVVIGCPKHGWFEKLPMLILQRKEGCPECGKMTGWKKRRTGRELFIERSRKIFGDKFNYDKVVYVNQHTKVTITCPIHGDFEQLPQTHLRGGGCWKCNNPYYYGRTKEDMIKDFNERHCGKYTYPNIPEWANNREIIEIVCPRHGSFNQRVANHLRGDGCPKCKNSKQELIIRGALTRENIRFEEQKTFPWLRRKGKMFLDFFLPDHNIAIECQGSQHFGIVSGFGYVMTDEDYIDLYERDRLKHSLCKHRGIKILYYCYYEGWVPDKYIDRVYTTKKELIEAIKRYKPPSVKIIH